MFSRILVPTDGSRLARHATDFALSLAKQHAGVLRFVFVLDFVLLDLGLELGANVAVEKQRMEQEAEGMLAQMVAYATERGVGADSRLCEVEGFGHRIATVLVDEATAWDADLIVMGTHGRRGWNRLLLGSSAEGVLRLAETPVLMIPEATAVARDARPSASKREG